MRTCYVETAYRSIVDLVPPGELTPYWTITRINVPQQDRGKGLGSNLLRRVLADADAEGVTLMLEAQPSDGLGRDELLAWYERHGFRATKLGYLKRLPKQ